MFVLVSSYKAPVSVKNRVLLLVSFWSLWQTTHTPPAGSNVCISAVMPMIRPVIIGQQVHHSSLMIHAL